jgi:hypothetical protein
MDFAEANRERIEKLLGQDSGNTRAVIARTIETKKIAGKLNLLENIIFKVRMQRGYSIDDKEAGKLLDMFKNIDSAMDSLIEKATELGVIRPKKPRMREYQDNILKMLEKKKTAEEITNSLQNKNKLINADMVKSWIANLTQNQ